MEVEPRSSRWTAHERVAFMLDAAREFGSTLDAQRIYATLLKFLSNAMLVDGIVVSAFEPRSETIHCAYAWSDGEVVDVSTLPPIQWNRSGTGMQSQVIKTGKAAIFDVPSKVREPNTSYVQVGADGKPIVIEQAPETKSAMMAPLLLEGGVTGVVQVMSDRPSAYGDEELEILEALALLMTPAWHHARSYDQVTQQRRLNDRILETSPDIVYIFDLRSGALTFCNGQLERQLGYSEADVAAMDQTTLPRVMHPDDAVRLPELLDRYQRASDTDLLESEWRISTKDGDWKWFFNRARVFERDATGKPIKILGFATDVSERRESERRRQESEARYRLLAETGPHLVWSAGPDGDIDYVNQQWHEYFGEGVMERISSRAELIHEEDRDFALSRYQAAIAARQPFNLEYRLRRHDGDFRWFICKGEPIRDEAGGVSRWLGVLFDIHRQKEIEEELSKRVGERTAQLEAAVKELEGFTYTVSHDLRGPLRAISAASMILREDFGDVLPEEAKRHLLRQAEAAKKMGVLIDDLLKLSRLGRQELRPESFDLSALATEVAIELGALDRIQIEPDLTAHGDPRLIKFVLLNLIENALKFSPEGGVVRLGRDGDEFFVSDTGIGFEEAYAGKIFLPFERLVREDEYPGTGIGLANVHRILQRHGGEIRASSQPGAGSTFYFTLPRR